MQKRREREREREEFLRRGIGDQKKSGDPMERFRVYQWVKSLFSTGLGT